MDPGTLISQFVATADDEDKSHAKYSGQLAELLTLKQLTLLGFIQALGLAITSDSDGLRTKAFQCMADTFQALAGEGMLKQDVQVILQFLLVKLDDKACLEQVLRALGYIIRFRSFKPSVDNNLSKVLSVITETYDPRRYLAKVRYQGFQVLQLVFDAHAEYLQANVEAADEFVRTFLHVASGEKDPRNLITLFRLNRNINEKILFSDSSTHAEYVADLFDVCFCYFPISFNPPVNDPYKITAADLKHELRLTIASQSLFAKDSFSSLFEKLTSTNPVVRNDVLQTLLLCVENYSQQVVLEYWRTLWDSLKFEVLHNDAAIFLPTADNIVPDDLSSIEDTDDNKLLLLTLVIFQHLTRVLTEQNQLQNFLTSVTTELEDNLRTVNDKTFKLSVVVLAAISVNGPAYNIIVNFLFSHKIWGRFLRSDQVDTDEMDIAEDVTLNVSKQRELIDNLGFLLIAYQPFDDNALALYKDHLLIFLGQLLQTSSNLEKTLKCKVIQQLVKLMTIPQLLDQQEYALVFGWLKDILDHIEFSSGWRNDLVLQESINGLIKLMYSSNTEDAVVAGNVQLVIEKILPTLLNYLDTHDPDVFHGILDIIISLCVNYQFLEVLTIRLLNKLSPDPAQLTLVRDLLQGFITAFKKTQSISQFLTNTWYKAFVPRLLSVLVQIDDRPAVELGGHLLGLVVRFTHKSKHQELLTDSVALFVSGEKEFGVNVPSVVEQRSLHITLFNNVLANIDKSVALDTSFSAQVTSFCYSPSDEYTRLGYLQNLALLTNKFGADPQLEALYARATNSPEDLEVFVWKIKALVVRSDKQGFEYLLRLVDLLEGSHAATVAASLSIVVSDLSIFTNEAINPKVKNIISAVNNLNVRLLYKQRLFELVLPRLVEGYATHNKEEYLVSLSIVLNNITSSILKPHLSDITPLILKSLSVNNPVILEAALNTFTIIIGDSPDLLVPHLSSVVPKLLDLSTKKIGRPQINTEPIRLLALEALKNIFTAVALPSVVPYQKDAIRLLVVALDDKKRSVRKLASDVRQVLYELGR